jgi:hypothetical protein
MQTVFQATNGITKFRHDNGEISQVKIEIAGMGTRRICVANLPPEIPDSAIRATFAKYGEVQDISEETWSRVYRYPVSNGVRIAVVAIKHHIPSLMIMAGHRVLITYEGQPLMCYGCNEIGHQYQACPHRRREVHTTACSPTTSWADIVSGNKTSQKPEGGKQTPFDSSSTPMASQHSTSQQSTHEVGWNQTMEATALPDLTEGPRPTDGDERATQTVSPQATIVVDMDTPMSDDGEARDSCTALETSSASLHETKNDDMSTRASTAGNGSTEGKHSNDTDRNDGVAPQHVESVSTGPHLDSPKPTKKMRTDRDRGLPREPKRSKTRNSLTPRL